MAGNKGEDKPELLVLEKVRRLAIQFIDLSSIVLPITKQENELLKVSLALCRL
jgi:hypothetical protein